MKKNIKYGVSKYKNIMGITCYMNSILHILQHIPYFIDYIYNKKFEENINKKLFNLSNEELNNITKKYLIYELYKLFKISLDNDNAIITPLSFKKCIGDKNSMWNEFNQQDSQEFLNFLLIHIQEEVGINYEKIYNKINHDSFNFDIFLNNNNISNIINNIIVHNVELNNKCKEYSILSVLFNGLIETSKRCMYCNSKSYIYDSYMTLCLSIPNKNIHNLTIYDCFDEFIKEEQVDYNNLIDCELCGLKNRSFRRSFLWKTPIILILHINRFYNNPKNLSIEKLTNNIIYPIKDLDLEKYFCHLSPYKHKSKYNLIGINIHHGLKTNINIGHYVSIIKNKINNKWYLYNDEHNVIELKYKKDLQNSDAYLLFYCQQ